jgi:hypothetical protein
MRAAVSHQGDEMPSGSLDYLRNLITDRLPWHAREICNGAASRISGYLWQLCENSYDRSSIDDMDANERGKEAIGRPRFKLRH